MTADKKVLSTLLVTECLHSLSHCLPFTHVCVLSVADPEKRYQDGHANNSSPQLKLLSPEIKR